MSLFIDVVKVNEREVSFLKIRLENGMCVTLGWVDNFGNLHMKK